MIRRAALLLTVSLLSAEPVSARDAEAAFAEGERQANGDGVVQSHAAAVSAYEEAARAGHAAAQNRLGRLNFEGLGTPRDRDAALDWFAKAADGGAPEHLFDYARALEATGDDGALPRAAALYRDAAEAGHIEAAVSLGVLYQDGRGVPRDPQEALRLYTIGAAQDHPRAMNNLGLLHARGDGVPQDYARAAQLFDAAAEAGLREAATNLGVMYENGFGVPLDEEEAHRLYRLGGAARGAETPGSGLYYDPRLRPPEPGPEARAARDAAVRAGDPVAAFQAAWLLLSPNPEAAPAEDLARAVALTELAADAGYAPAMINLALHYETGVGVPQNYVLARSWLLRAAAAGLEVAQHRGAALQSRMTAEQINTAQTRALE
ncbi:tetratricopeptide repeat protein [Roseivivax sediminis]|uniref:TPR repeat n=1 Tax=Roseivivax sediminis TaxID=936889 RepID=A0A1I2ABP7_9RHOB|nr:SEL1-like repeat protein [Roseivivax sediminis]SFE41292.1 hypothetical protein SAMN04515678_109168 [Roseivivax sediminis]